MRAMPYRILIYIGICAVTLGGGVLFHENISTEILGNQLAAISSIEHEAVMRWRNSGGLKKESKEGEEGASIWLLQRALYKDDPLNFKKEDISGFFGPTTKKALESFQNKHGLEVSGRLDGPTIFKINSLYFNELCKNSEKAFSDTLLYPLSPDFPLPEDYAPSDLVRLYETPRLKVLFPICVRNDVRGALEQLSLAAQRDGIYLGITSGYRDFDTQEWMLNHWLKIQGDGAFYEVSLSGLSEHHLGTAVDFTGKSISYASVSPNFKDSKEYKWLNENAYLWGFVESYPEHEKSFTGYKGEAWHFRYVGAETAYIIQGQGVNPVRFLKDRCIDRSVRGCGIKEEEGG